MSGVAGLFNIPLTQEALFTWSATHMTHHRDINHAIYELTGIALPEYVLDPIDPRDTRVWEAQHQIMHTNFDIVLGIPGFDLSEVNFLDPDSMAGWIQLNSSEHYQAANILGIG